MSMWSRLTNVFRSGRVESELDEELQFHIDERIRELTAAGMTPEAAAREVASRFGSPLRLRERSLDVKLLPWLDSVVRDARLGVRMLRKDAVITGAAVVSLSLALGACVAAFSLVDALILRPLPVRDPQQLVYLAFPTYSPERPEADTFNDPLFVRLRDGFSRARRAVRDEHAGGAAGGTPRRRRREGTAPRAARLRRRVRKARHRTGRRAGAGRAGRRASGRESGGRAEPRVLAAAVRRGSHDRWALADAGRQAAADRRRGRAAVHRRRAGASNGSVGAVRDVQPPRVREPLVRLVPHRRAPEGGRPARAGAERAAGGVHELPPRICATAVRAGAVARERRALPRGAALRAAGGQRGVAGAPRVRAVAVDSVLDRGAGAAHRRLERREPVSGPDRRARARDGAAAVDRRGPRPVDPADARRKRDRGRGRVRAGAALRRGRRARRSSTCSRRPTIRCVSIFAWTGGSSRSPAG